VLCLDWDRGHGTAPPAAPSTRCSLPAGCRPRDCWHCQFSDQAPPMVETEAHGSTMLTWLVTSMEHGAWQPEPETSQTFDSRNSRRNIINHLDHLSCKMSTAWESKDIKVSHAWHSKVKYKTMLNYLLLGFGFEASFQFAVRSTSRLSQRSLSRDPGGTHRSGVKSRCLPCPFPGPNRWNILWFDSNLTLLPAQTLHHFDTTPRFTTLD